MSPEPRPELTELSELAAHLRAHLERERFRGRAHLDLPRLHGPAPVPVAGHAEEPAKAPVRPEAGEIPGKPSPPPASSGSRGSGAPPGGASGGDGGRGGKLPPIPIEKETPDYASRMATLGKLATKASTCTLCGLCETRKQVVFGVGRARTRVMFIGEAPGGDEDRLGQPFVGRAGKLLDRIIEAAGFTRDEVYIANILKCRPPNNRNPEPVEIEACTPYLTEQIEILQPKIICTLGKFAGQFITDQPKATMGGMRGRVAMYRDRIKVVPTYHPAALLRNPNLKRDTWEDFQLLRREYLS